jgi:hypothetical protein
VVRLTQADNQPHSTSHLFPGPWGYPALFMQTCPLGTPYEEAAQSLDRYMKAKKHQTRVDRALGLVLDTGGNIVGGTYMNTPATDDADLDRLVAEMDLVPPDRSRRPSRSTAAVKARRERKKKNGKRRR